MRALLACLVVSAASVAVLAQAPAAPAGLSSAISSSEVAALIAKAKAQRKDEPLISQRLLSLAPYNVNLEYRASVGTAAIHETEAEMFYVVEGAGTMVTGGTLTDEKRQNAENLQGSGIAGGQPRQVAKGDFIMVPEGVAHWFSKIDGTLVLMSVHLPHKPGAK